MQTLRQIYASRD